MSDARVLAELMGWTDVRSTQDGGSMGFAPNVKIQAHSPIPDYDTDINAMREVWKVLKEKGLWDEFCAAFDNHTFREAGVKGDFDLRWHFVHDLTGQVKAAIKVLKEAQG